MECPDCGKNLKDTAKRCACGWKNQDKPEFKASPGHRIYINPNTTQPFSEHMQRIIERSLEDRRGWRGEAENLDCSNEGCQNPAAFRVKTALGWAVFCRVHYDAYHVQAAKDYCESVGLGRLENETRTHWVERMRSWNREVVKSLQRKMIVDREPGSDG